MSNRRCTASAPSPLQIRPQWARTRTWWRAFRHAVRHRDFWQFIALQLGLVLVVVVVDRMVVPPGLATWPAKLGHALVFGIGLGVPAYLQVSLGGDMMRRHLRAVSDVARFACPRCGQSLYGHATSGDASLRCPECAADVPPALFEPPYCVPAAFRMFPPRHLIGRGDDTSPPPS